jgi:hypothetical protein
MPVVERITRYQMAIAIIPFALGILNLVLKGIMDDADAAENIIEWVFALLMHSYFLLTYFSWRATGFAGSFVKQSNVMNVKTQVTE